MAEIQTDLQVNRSGGNHRKLRKSSWINSKFRREGKDPVHHRGKGRREREKKGRGEKENTTSPPRTETDDQAENKLYPR